MGYPGRSLSSSEQTCLRNCAQRWVDVQKVIVTKMNRGG